MITPYGELPPGSHAIGDTVVTVNDAETGWTEQSASPPNELATIWPYEFQGLLTDDQLVAIQTSMAPALIRMRTKVQTLVTPMPFDPSSELYQGIQLLGMLMPELFTAAEVSRILSGQAPE